MRLIPFLLCWMSGTALAAGLQPLVVSPDLVRSPKAAASPASAPGAVTAGAPAAASRPVPAQAAPDVKPPAEGRAAQTQPAPASPPAQAEQARRRPAPEAAALPAGSTSVKALRILGARSIELVADGDAELQRDDMVLTADRVTYREPIDEAVAEGNVELRQGEDSIAGPKATMVVGESTGTFESPAYELTRQRQPNLTGEEVRTVSGRGQADLLRLEGENQYRLENATWSTCQASDPDWYIKARELDLDYDREVGTARNGSIVFMDVPILWMPWAEFPLTARRQSGLLPPTFGSSNKTGADLAVPYYWNIAPNYDATITPRFMSRRGVQIGGEFRYLGETYRGESRVEWMPKDRLAGEERTLASIQHEQRITPSLYGSLDLNSVSDDRYFEDLSSRIGVASRVNLLRQGQLVYRGSSWWNAVIRAQSYQTLNPDEESRNVAPYRRLPQILVKGQRPDLPGGLSASFSTEYVKFAHPDADRNKDEGTRFVAYPQLALPLAGAAWFVTPKAGLHYTSYDIDRSPLTATQRSSITRSAPIFSVDSGLFFEREATIFGGDYLQTLEPRLYYLRVPSRDQADIPNFDTSRFDVGFAQMFSENRFSGSDRIGDANDLTAALTTRFIDSGSGVERLRAMIGQRYYFSDQKVYLYNEDELRDAGRGTEVLLGLGGRISREFSLNSYLQYNTETSRTERANFNLRYQPDYAKVLNISYRYAPELRIAENLVGLEDVDVSGQWPLGRGWYGVGRVTHSLLENRVTEAIGGLEYNGGCWVFRVAVHRFAIERDDVSQSIYVQLELNDLAGIGSNPLNLLTRSVPGYGKINDSSADRVFGMD
ncbi:LPS-assembly protein LptD [Thauera linaloolentis]|nr:LPS-assembly protein LptD [Thauera linaloolentis]MCM8564055.1 LPS-assembly protein LptD [Thauera linaloolentis]